MFEDIDKRQDLDMLGKGLENVKKYEIKYEKSDIYELIILYFNKKNRFKPLSNEEKYEFISQGEQYELMAIENIINRKISELNLEERDNLIRKLNDYSIDLDSKIDDQKSSLIDEEEYTNLGKELYKQGHKTSSIVLRYSEGTASETEKLYIEETKKRLFIKDTSEKIKLISDLINNKIKNNYNDQPKKVSK